MKFGYFANLNDLGLEKSRSQALDETRGIALACEDAGWDTLGFADRHFGHEGFGVVPDEPMIDADLGARTHRIRVAQAANITPSGIRSRRATAR